MKYILHGLGKLKLNAKLLSYLHVQSLFELVASCTHGWIAT